MLKITIYSTPTCNKCRMLKDYLNERGVEFEDKDAIECYDEVKDTGFAAAPIIKIETIVEWEDNPNMWFEDMEDFITYFNNHEWD